MNVTSPWRVLAIVLLASGAAFGLARLLPPPVPMDDELNWLVAEFQLTPAETAAVQALHEAYQPICDRHCAAIRSVQTRLHAAEDARVRAALTAEMSTLQETCHTATRRHLQKVAAAMGPEKGRRYIELIAPRLSAHLHDEPFGLR